MRIYHCCSTYCLCDARTKQRSWNIKLRAVVLKEEFAEVETVIIRRKAILKVGESKEGKSEIYLPNYSSRNSAKSICKGKIMSSLYLTEL